MVFKKKKKGVRSCGGVWPQVMVKPGSPFIRSTNELEWITLFVSELRISKTELCLKSRSDIKTIYFAVEINV